MFQKKQKYKKTRLKHTKINSTFIYILSIIWMVGGAFSCRQSALEDISIKQGIFLEARTRNLTSLDPNESSLNGGIKEVNTGCQSRLSTLRLLAFTPEGELVCNELKTGLETMTQNPVYYIKDKGTPNSHGKYFLNLIYIGNETSSMTPHLEAVINLDQFKNNRDIILADYNYDQNMGFHPVNENIVMTAFNVGAYSVDVTEPYNETNPLSMEVILTRAFAKIEVIVVKNIDKYPISEYTTIEEISLVNVAPKYYIFYNSRFLNDKVGLPEFGTTINPFKTVVKKRDANASLNQATFYVPPNEVTDNTKSTQLRIKMSSTIAPAQTYTTFFVDMDSQLNQSLSRLSHYKITVVPKGLEQEGIEIHTEVVPWDTKTLYQFLGDFFLIEVEDPMFAGDTNTVSIKETIYIESDPALTNIPHDYEWKVVAKNGVTIDDASTTEKTINLDPAPSAQPYTLHKNGMTLSTGTVYAEVWRRDIKADPAEEFKLIKSFKVGTSL